MEQQVKFYIYSWFIDDSEEITSIRIYGVNEKNENVCARVDDFTPYVYIELPPERIVWNAGKAQLVGNKIDELLGNKRPLKKVLMMKKKLYGAYLDKHGKAKLFPYLFCSFSSSKDIKVLGYKLRNNIHIVGIGPIKLKMHESNADPILQLTCCRHISTAGWVEFYGKEQKEESKLTLCDKEYKVKWKNISPITSDIIAKPKIMGFDIEVNSTNPSAMPNAKKPGDKVFQISCVIARFGDPESKYEKYLLSLGQPDQETVGEDVLIYTYETESDLLEGFTKFIREENPNLIVGYNILGFDIPYMIDRAKINMCIFNFDQQGFHKFAHAKEKTIKWSSSAYKNQEFQFLDAEGRVFVDLLPLVRRDYKFDNYKLKTISDFFLGQTKDPLSVKGIFKCYRIGTKKNEQGEYSLKAQKAISIVGKYCVQDSLLTVLLMDKLQMWIGLTEMAKTCKTSIFSLYTQGQQIKVFSQLYQYCLDENIVVETDAYQVSENERFIGAKVFPPIKGRHGNVVPFDFASLYPSTIIAYNIDYHTWVPDDSDIPDSECHVMEWSDHISCSHDPKVIRTVELTKYITSEQEIIKSMRDKRNKTLDKLRKKELMNDITLKLEELKPYVKERSDLNKSKSKFPMCCKRYYRFLKEPRGVLPTVIQNLLDARKHTRKVDMVDCYKKIDKLKADIDVDHSIEINDLKTLLNILDKRQLAYKISANSVSPNTPIPCIDDTGNFLYLTIEEISDGLWFLDNENNEVSNPKSGLSVWTEKGYTKIKFVIRHPKRTPLKRVLTHTGCVDVTDEHSLLDENAKEVRTIDLKIGDKLLHSTLPLPKDTPKDAMFWTVHDETIQQFDLKNNLQYEEAFLLGLFFAEGTAGNWGVLKNAKSSWIIYNQDYNLLERAKIIAERVEQLTFTISPFYDSAGVYHLRPNGNKEGDIVLLCKKYRELLYDQRGTKRIPSKIFKSDFYTRQSFFMGYYAGDGDRFIKKGVVIQNKGEIGTAGLCYLMKSLGYIVSISYYPKKESIYRLQCCSKFRNKKTTSIKTIIHSTPVPKIKKLQPDIIRNNTKIFFDEGVVFYRGVTINCVRIPRQKLLDAIDRLIGVMKSRHCSITEYYTYSKKIKYKTWCCCKTSTTQVKGVKYDNVTYKTICECENKGEDDGYNDLKSFVEDVNIEYIYDIETENHHFAAGIGDLIVHNSMYGAMGVRKGYLPFMPGAMVTCYMGRVNIEKVANEITTKYKGELIYGDTDSVLPDCPILVSYNSKLEYKTMEELSDGDWKLTVTGKEISNAKEGLLVWSDNGFTPIKQVIRHAITKPLIRVLTHVGCVECTLDHSLLWENGYAAKASDVQVGSKLCIKELPLPLDTPKIPIYKNKLTENIIEDYIIPDVSFENMTAELAFVWGMFYTEGSCGTYKGENSGKQSKWAISGQDNKLLNRCVSILNKYEENLQFKILDTMDSSNANKLVPFCKKRGTPGQIVEFVDRYRNLFYDCRRSKRVPPIILNSPFDIRQSFFMGYYAGDGSKKDPAICLSNKGAIGSAGLFYIMKSIGYQVSINTRMDKPTIYKLTGSTPEKKMRYSPNVVKKIYPTDIYNSNEPLIRQEQVLENQPEYIYDIETENHHFSAGVGELVVHNSNYITFPHLKTAHETWDYAIEVAKNITKLFPKPISLEFENAIYSFFFILTKKRYMYRQCLRDGIVDDKIGKKGVLLSRRDSSQFVRDIYESIIGKIADNISHDDICYWLLTEINLMFSGCKTYKDFVVTKAIGNSGGVNVEAFVNEKGVKKAKVGDYTVPFLSKDKEEREEQLKKKGADNEGEFYLLCLPAQVQLAERMRSRGQRVDAGSRLEYVVTNPELHLAKQYEKVESYDYFVKHTDVIKIDHFYYLKALTNPLDQMLDVAFPLYKDFVLNQYNFRWKIRHKLLTELKDLFKPKLIFD